MMAIKTILGYECSYCRRLYDTPQKADSCRNKHDLLYLAISKEDLQNLKHFIYTKDDKLISEGLLQEIDRKLKRATIGKLEYDD
jgi:hypothetical protein